MVSDSESTVVKIHLSPGNEHDADHGRRSMAALGAFMGAHLLMDRAYEGNSTRLPAESFGLTPVMPSLLRLIRTPLPKPMPFTNSEPCGTLPCGSLL